MRRFFFFVREVLATVSVSGFLVGVFMSGFFWGGHIFYYACDRLHTVQYVKDFGVWV